jgi:formylglycine-generating enzyme required for sulfatase activity
LYRLPTEAEWEYAARSGGKSEKYAGTSSESELTDYAWYEKNSGGKTHPVGQKKPNGLGIYDMSGNVWEWVNDWYNENYYKNSPKNNPTGPSSGKEYKVLRGGAWSADARASEAAYRYGLMPPIRFNFYGIRLAFPAK